MREVQALGGFQYFCPGFVVSHGNPVICEINVPVPLDGLTVQPGDLLHGDVNGVLVVPDGIADRVVEQASGCGRRKRRCWISYEARG